eukprot:scaffold230105_cov30-Tisochrysis_lutea.AAC.3
MLEVLANAVDVSLPSDGGRPVQDLDRRALARDWSREGVALSRLRDCSNLVEADRLVLVPCRICAWLGLAAARAHPGCLQAMVTAPCVAALRFVSAAMCEGWKGELRAVAPRPREGGARRMGDDWGDGEVGGCGVAEEDKDEDGDRSIASTSAISTSILRCSSHRAISRAA